MTWDYRIIEHDIEEPVYFAIHEVYYDENGLVESWTKTPINLSGESVKELSDDIKKS